MRAIQNAGGTWQMLTLTIRHRNGDRLLPMRKGIMLALRKMRARRDMAPMFAKVSGSARVIEITHGANGWHPHLHLLLRTEEWSAEEQAMLETTWRKIVSKIMGPQHAPDLDHGAKWSPPIRVRGDRPLTQDGQAAYIAKLGLEVTWNAKSTRAKTSRNPWEIGRDAAEGCELSRSLWLEYEASTYKCRALELDDRAAAWAKGEELPLQLDVEHVCEPVVEDTSEPIAVLDVSNEELRTIRRAEKVLPRALYLTLRVVEANPTREALDQWIYELAKLAPPRLRAPPLVA